MPATPCSLCVHLVRPIGERLTCSAYPDGIPVVITLGAVQHTVARADQVGRDVYRLRPEARG